MITAITGGIGSGKTMSMVWYALQDLGTGKKIFSNVKFRFNHKNITYLNRDIINNMFDKVKNNDLDMKNSTIIIQEMHNYMDSRTSQSKKNRTLSYWILQSRHTGQGSCDIIFDTQELRQVDVRLRSNIDMHVKPYLSFHENKPYSALLDINAKIGHKNVRMIQSYMCCDVMDKYDTHEIVMF